MRYVPLYCKAEPGSASSQSRPTVLKEMISPLAGVTVPVSLAAKQRPGGKKDETTSRLRRPVGAGRLVEECQP